MNNEAPERIKRFQPTWSPDPKVLRMTQHDHGEWVLHKDHLAQVERLERELKAAIELPCAERIRELERERDEIRRLANHQGLTTHQRWQAIRDNLKVVDDA